MSACESPMRVCALCDVKHVNTNDSDHCVWFGPLVADTACVAKYADEAEELRREYDDESDFWREVLDG